MIQRTFWLLALLLLSACSTEPIPPKPADQPAAAGRATHPGTPAATLQPADFPALPIDYRPQRGQASQYRLADHGARTHSGEPYDFYALSAAHPQWPMGTYVRVTSVQTQRSVVVRINDRNQDGHALRLSVQAAKDLRLSLGRVSEVRFQALRTRGKTTLRLQPPTTPQQAQYYVQAGAFAQAENAQQLGQTLSALAAVHIQPSNGLHRVHLGPLPHTQARGVLMQLSDYGVNSGFLLPAGD